MIELRDAVLEKLRAELFGPAGPEDETVEGRPYWRYLCGMLFPIELASDRLEENDEKDAQAVATGNEQADPAIALAYDALPSSMGISFFVSGTSSLSCRVEGARYEPKSKGRESWVRRVLGRSDQPTVVTFEAPKPGERVTAEEHLFGVK